MDSAPQPKRAAGGSDDDDARAPAPVRSSLEARLVAGGGPLAGVGVVMLEPLSGRGRTRIPKERIVEQRGHEFAPHVLAVPVGSTVSFPNFDPIYHNVFSLSAPARFDLGLYKNGETREVKLEKEGVVRLGCNIHPSMAAFVIVVSAPHYAVADASGVARFKRLAPGRYRLKAWSERLAHPAVTEVEVKPGENQTTVALEEGPPVPNPDKFGDDR